MENETKLCSFCHKEKEISCFRKSGKYYRGECKQCEKEKHYLYVEKNREKINKKIRENYRQDKEKRNISQRIYREQNEDKIKKQRKEYYNNHKEYFKDKARKYRLEHRTILSENQKKWVKENPEKVKLYQRKDYDKRKSDPILRFKQSVRNMIGTSFYRKGETKSKKLANICGCNIEELIIHLINTYEKNYSEKWDWEKANNVHIDHIIPLAKAKSKTDVEKLCHYTNLQLLKANDNLSKGCKENWHIC